jgi:hypothetical protein
VKAKREETRMRVFNEEATKTKECIIIVSFDEIKLITAALDKAYESNPRKKSLKKLIDQIETAAVY